MIDNIIFGMPTLIECKDLYDNVKLCKELSLKFVEINMNLPQYQISTIDKEQLKQISAKENIYFTIHLDENINVCDFNREIAKAYIKTVLDSIKLAKELEIPILNMHMTQGVHFTLPDKKVYLFAEYKDRYLSDLRKFREMCAEAIGESNIKICIENTSGYKDFMIEGVMLLLESNVFSLTWDIGHDHCTKEMDKNFIEANIERLVHMHFHDAKGSKDHLVLGTGNIDLSEKVSIAKNNNCRCVIESKTIDGLRKSVCFLEGDRHL